MLKAAKVIPKALFVEIEPDSWPQHCFSELHEDYTNAYESAASEEKKI